MTQALYFESDSTTGSARVLSCQPMDDGLWAVVLDRTLFHPQGGGQPSDVGTINGIAVRKVIHTEDEIVHLTEQPLSGEAALCVNEDKRRLHSRLHSAGHLVGLVGDQLGWHAVGGNHFPGEARVMFKPEHPELFSELIDASEFENRVNQLIHENLECTITENAEGFRTVTWGNLPAYPCGGTHVQNTSEIGRVRITKIKFKKGQITVFYQLEEKFA